MSKLEKFIDLQKNFEKQLEKKYRKNNGVFFTHDTQIIELTLKHIKIDHTLLNKKILEPACGNGIFLLHLLIQLSIEINSEEEMYSFIENNIYFNDWDEENINLTKNNIKDLYYSLYKKSYTGSFNDYVYDFTIKDNFKKYFNSFDYIIGNPPYVSLYGRRDQKKSEEQRSYYLKNYSQFPKYLENGKINLTMIFIEQSINLLKKDATLSFIIDITFFETAYIHLRKYLLENTQILSITYDISAFENVTSGQLVLTVKKGYKKHNTIDIVSYSNSKKNFKVPQDKWNNEKDHYKFRLEEYCDTSNKILKKILEKNDKSLKELYPKKNLRTGVMLLNMEEEFVLNKNLKYNETTSICYKYYKGSKSIKAKYSKPTTDLMFYFDEKKKETINNKLQNELKLKGIKNKKRLGFGESLIYDNPKIYIRQSAKELITTYDETKSCCNNSLYIFTLRDNTEESKIFLKYLTGFFNSKITTFIAQKRRIIRYEKGKQPQIKVSDLYSLHIPMNEDFILKISSFVDKYISTQDNKYLQEIDMLIIQYYDISLDEEKFIENSITEFLL